MLDFDRRRGAGETPVVLLHSLALDRSVWRWFIPRLPERLDLLVPDLPGHGRSPGLPQTTIESMADEVARLVEAEADGPVVAVGLSLGGCVAQALAVRHPHLVRGLGLLDTTCWYGETAPQDWEARAMRAVNEGLGSLAEFQLARWLTQGFLESNPEVGQELLRVFQSTGIDDYVASCRAMGALDLRDEVQGITVPTSIVVGAEDPATSPPHSEDLHRRIPGATLHVVPQCSHLSAVEQPAVIARLLEENLLARLGG